MLTALFDSSVRLRELRAGPAGELRIVLPMRSRTPVTPRSPPADIVRAAEHFAAWAARHGPWTSVVAEQIVMRFKDHVHRCRCRRYGHADRSLLHGAGLFVRHLQETGVVREATCPDPRLDSALLSAFRVWMREQRGTCDATSSTTRSPSGTYSHG